MKDSSKHQQNGKVYIGAKVPVSLKERLSKRAKRERRSASAIIEIVLTRELFNKAGRRLDFKLPRHVKKFFAAYGRAGGRSTSKKKRAAARRNVAKAIAARKIKHEQQS